MTKPRFYLFLALPLVAAFAIAGSQLTTRSNIVYGDEQPMGDGTVRSFLKQDAEGNPVQLGLLLTAGAMQNLPVQPPHHGPAHEMTLALPAQIKGRPFDHISIDWNPVGHEPEGLYDAPHFDFHFYVMSEADRNTIDPSRTDFEVKASRHPDPEFLPANHMLAPGAVPRMGNHWVDRATPELNGQPFSTTFIYGTWDGLVTFLEPMITKTYMESVREMEGHTVTNAIPQAAAVQTTGYYPTSYSVQYDPKADTYAVTLDGLTLR